ncbi:Fe2+-dependent dioxygenase [Hydrogenophaga sp. 5NK40-0174]|uniref:Fe2+-dependent dioxygenase n=1 Tax=Hydrogenophaga sp. 5NK40-0174 TaxID=3127649 RepID=UPI0031044F61
MLVQLPRLLDADTLRSLRTSLETAPWEDGESSAGAQARQVKNNLQLPHDCPQARQVQAAVLGALDRSNTFFSAALPLKVFTPRVNCYNAEHSAYGRHVDNAIRLKPQAQGGADPVRTDLSCTVFLSEPDEYDGGELVIQDTYGQQSVKLAAGDAVLYPGTSVHEVLPVTRGARLASFFWIQSMVRSDEQRRLLHTLDNTTVDLRVQHGETDHAVALTGIYHNLLRMWAQT